MSDLFARTDAGERIAGVDEVGRGPLAGPVVAAAVIPAAVVTTVVRAEQAEQIDHGDADAEDGGEDEQAVQE